MDNTHKIINFLGKHASESFTMYTLSKKVGIPYATFHRTIQTIPELVTKQTIGKSTVVSLRRETLTKSYLVVSSFEEAKEYLSKQPLIKKIAEELPKGEYAALLFGSYAKDLQGKKSDIDILVINKDGRKEPGFSKYETLFGVEINPLYFSKKEFAQMLKSEEENVGTQALKNHIVLYNPEYFWGIIYGV